LVRHRGAVGVREQDPTGAGAGGLLHLGAGWAFRSRIRCGTQRRLMRGYL